MPIDRPTSTSALRIPGAPMTRLIQRDMVVFATRRYDGTTAVTRGEHLDPEEVEFMRWKAGAG